MILYKVCDLPFDTTKDTELVDDEKWLGWRAIALKKNIITDNSSYKIQRV